MTSVFQGLSLSRSKGREGEDPGNEVESQSFCDRNSTASNCSPSSLFASKAGIDKSIKE